MTEEQSWTQEIMRDFPLATAGLTEQQVEDAWCLHSEDYSAGWLMHEGYTEEQVAAVMKRWVV